MKYRGYIIEINGTKPYISSCKPLQLNSNDMVMEFNLETNLQANETVSLFIYRKIGRTYIYYPIFATSEKIWLAIYEDSDGWRYLNTLSNLIPNKIFTVSDDGSKNDLFNNKDYMECSKSIRNDYNHDFNLRKTRFGGICDTFLKLFIGSTQEDIIEILKKYKRTSILEEILIIRQKKPSGIVLEHMLDGGNISEYKGYFIPNGWDIDDFYNIQEALEAYIFLAKLGEKLVN